MIRYWPVVLLLGALVGCSRVGCVANSPDGGVPQIEKPPTAVLQAVVQADNQFACEMYADVSKQPGNLVLSPASVSTALAMTYPGAAGNTAEQMKKVLHWGESKDHHAVNSYRLAEWAAASHHGNYQLSVANGLWGQFGKTWKPEFLHLTQDLYKAGFQQVDFAKPDEARGKINEWVAERTEKKIPELLPAGSITDLTRLVLTNAIYFKSTWAYSFKKEGTEEHRFYTAPAESVKVPMMYQTYKFNYAMNDTVGLLEMPYKGKDLGMLIIMPHNISELPKVEKSLSANQIAKWLDSMKLTEVNVGIPRFKISTDLKLKETLQALGMTDAFNDTKADFSNLETTDKLFISNVYHKGFVEVNEEGTEAVGATGVLEVAKGGPEDGPRHQPPQFHADRPFIFVIRDLHNGSILFMGRVANPTK